ncbi:MAG TPA: hypothetical protein VGL54_00095 [Solirubrobacteraceae bacterium]|jgi:hypothetical protein
MHGDLYGVWAKYQRGMEQLTALHKEVLAFGKKPHPYTIYSQVNDERTHYVFALKPAWPTDLHDRWGAIIGEIVHDFRSALDQLVCEFVRLNGGTPRKSHSFPLRKEEPTQGFAVEMRRQRADRRGHMLYGPLFGVSDDAVALIESCQPYKGPNGARLRQLHDLWNTDKHETLIPTILWGPDPEIKLTNAILIAQPPGRFEGDTYLIEVLIAAESVEGPDPKVDVEPHAPIDIALSDGREPVIEALRNAATVVLIGLLHPAMDLFPEDKSVRLPF